MRRGGTRLIKSVKCICMENVEKVLTILADVILYCMHPTLWLFSINVLFLNWQWVTVQGQLLTEEYYLVMHRKSIDYDNHPALSRKTLELSVGAYLHIAPENDRCCIHIDALWYYVKHYYMFHHLSVYVALNICKLLLYCTYCV